MSELAPRQTTVPAVRENADRTLGTMVYGLYLAAPLTLGLSAVGGMLLAAKRRERADPVAASHYRFQLWTFWAAVFAAVAGGLWVLLGGARATGAGDGDAAWLAVAGGVLCLVAGVGYVAANVYGLARLLSRSPIGRFFDR